MKEQFLKELREALQGQVSSAVYQDTMQYYTRYIDEEMKKGRSEREVIESLGSGRILAKTVIDSQAKTQSAQASSRANGYTEQRGETQQPSFATKAKTIAILAAVLVVVVALAGIVIHVLWALLPLILIVALIMWLVRRI